MYSRSEHITAVPLTRMAMGEGGSSLVEAVDMTLQKVGSFQKTSKTQSKCPGCQPEHLRMFPRTNGNSVRTILVLFTNRSPAEFIFLKSFEFYKRRFQAEESKNCNPRRIDQIFYKKYRICYNYFFDDSPSPRHMA